MLKLDVPRNRFFQPRLQSLSTAGVMPGGGTPGGDAFYRVPLSHDGSPSEELWACARVLSVKSLKTLTSMKGEVLRDPPATGRGEVKAAKWLQRRVRESQRSLPKQRENCWGMSRPKCLA